MQPIRPERLSQIETERPAIYVGRPDEMCKDFAMTYLANGLNDFTVRRFEEALEVYEANLQWAMRRTTDTSHLLSLKGNIANVMVEANKVEEGIARMRANFAEGQSEFGPEHKETLITANDLCGALISVEDYAGCKQFIQENSLLDKVERNFGPDCVATFTSRRNLARALYLDEDASLDDTRRAIEILEDLSPRAHRLLGPTDPFPRRIQENLDGAREELEYMTRDA